MPRFLSLIALVLIGASVRADAPTIADLVKQLGDPKFAVREAAQKELLKRGEGIVPELDRLAKGADAEMADRIGKVRYNLVGYKDEIRRLLAEVHEGKDSAAVPISDELRGLIAESQPGSGNVLIQVLSDPKHKLHRQAVLTFMATWDVATPDQIDAYVQKTVTLKTAHRAKFPAKVGAMISFEAQPLDGWTGWPLRASRTFTFNTRTTRHVDGKPYDKPFECRYPFATVGRIRVGELAEGKHTIHAVMEYEFTQNGQKRKGQIRSKDSTFEVLAADTPDDLVAPKSAELAAAFRRLFIVHDGSSPAAGTGPRMPAGADVRSDWLPQVTWQAGGKWHGLSGPVWVLKEGLPADLSFDVEIKEAKSGQTFAADPIVVRRGLGRTAQGYIVPRNVEAFAADRDGFLTVQVLMKPSRALALSKTDITRYYPESFESAELRIRVSSAPTQRQLYAPEGK